MDNTSNKLLNMAICYATEKHGEQKRKLANTPYILHPLEVAAIISTLTDDREVMAAGCLHDTIEDCGADPVEISQIFGKRVSALVQSESEDRLSTRPEEETWLERKTESLLFLEKTKDINVKIMWLADKLSNMRSFHREYLKKGNDIWNSLHQKDPKMQEWYYRTIAANLSELSDTAAYKEYVELVDRVFPKGEN